MKKQIFFLLLALCALQPACKQKESPETPPDENTLLQISADTDGDGLVTFEDDLNGDGHVNQTDHHSLKLVEEHLGNYLGMLAELGLVANPNSLERWESASIATASENAEAYALELSTPEGMSGYMVCVINQKSFQTLSYGLFENGAGEAVFFDLKTPLAMAVKLDTYQATLLATDGDQGYWKCVIDCIEDELDGFAGSLCASVCAVCVLEPTKASCAACIACVGAVAAGCMIWCAW